MSVYTEASLRAEFRLHDPCDAWGNCMEWLFDIADSLHWHHNAEVPSEWDYRAGLSDAYDPLEDDGWERRGMLDKTDPETLRTFGAKLWRLRAILIAQGRDY